MHPGKIVCTLAPEGRNSRNSEGAFIVLGDRIRFLYSRFDADNGHDDANADIAEVVSRDGGESWSAPRVLFRASDSGAANLMSVSCLRLGESEWGLFYLVRRGPEDTRLVLRRSGDGGETWGEPVYCMDDLGYHVVNNDRVIRLSSGRLLIPAAIHPAGEDPRYRVRFDPFDAFYLSDDDGHTWRQSKSLVSYFTPNNPAGLQEPGLVELPGGVLWGYARTALGRHYEFFSYDGGESWTQAQPSQFTGPASPLQIKRSPFDGKLLAVWNPVPNYQTRETFAGWGRTPLVCAVSDGGMDFSEPLVLENDPARGFCYPAIAFLDAETALLAYCAGGEEDRGCLNRCVIRKMSLKQ